MVNSNEISEVRKHVQKVLNDVDDFLKTLETMKKGFLVTLSEDLQKLGGYLDSLEKVETKGGNE
jgi:hypothetical protein